MAHFERERDQKCPRKWYSNNISLIIKNKTKKESLDIRYYNAVGFENIPSSYPNSYCAEYTGYITDALKAHGQENNYKIECQKTIFGNFRGIMDVTKID